MFFSYNPCLVVCVTSRALFDLTEENEIFENEGVEAYCKYQTEHEDDIPEPGPGYALVKSLLDLNYLPGCEGRVEVIIMSHNSPDSSLRIFNAITYYGLHISRAILAGTASLVPYLKALRADLFLSANGGDVQAALHAGIAAGIIVCGKEKEYRREEWSPIRIAFDGDAVLFSDESEQIFRMRGLQAFEENEYLNACNPLKEGPFARFLKILSDFQQEFPIEQVPIRTALVTTRCAPAHERVIRTLRAWNVRIDEAFFLGGITKKDILKAFGAHIFFDDQESHITSAAQFVPSARVPYCNSPAYGFHCSAAQVRRNITQLQDIQSGIYDPQHSYIKRA